LTGAGSFVIFKLHGIPRRVLHLCAAHFEQSLISRPAQKPGMAGKLQALQRIGITEAKPGNRQVVL
jgi:hypothetical protein